MKAAAAFAAGLAGRGDIERIASVEVTLLGSLAFTGRGHATDKAVVLGLCGFEPEAVDPDAAEALVDDVRRTKRLPLAGAHAIAFDPVSAIVFDVVTPATRHPNTLRLVARDAAQAALDLALGRRRFYRTRRRGRGGGRERGERALSFPLGRRTARPRPRVRTLDRGARARQRGGAAPRRNS